MGKQKDRSANSAKPSKKARGNNKEGSNDHGLELAKNAELDLHMPLDNSAFAHSPSAFNDQNAALVKQTKRLARTLHSEADEEKNTILLNQIKDAGVHIDMNHLSAFLMKSPKDTLSTPVSVQRKWENNRTHVVTRQWEERFMHEPTGLERPCFNKQKNECFASCITTNGVRDNSLALCEFYPPRQYEEIKASGWKWPKAQQLCVLCSRQKTFQFFVEVRCGATCLTDTVNFSKIGNIIDQEGEYCKESCFLTNPNIYEGILDPVVIPCVNDYRIQTVNGVRNVVQMLPYPQQPDATGTADAHNNFFF
jgi:hypothetical protein